VSSIELDAHNVAELDDSALSVSDEFDVICADGADRSGVRRAVRSRYVDTVSAILGSKKEVTGRSAATGRGAGGFHLRIERAIHSLAEYPTDVDQIRVPVRLHASPSDSVGGGLAARRVTVRRLRISPIGATQGGRRSEHFAVQARPSRARLPAGAERPT